MSEIFGRLEASGAAPVHLEVRGMPGEPGPGAVDPAGRWRAVVGGNPRWTDAGLARIAAEQNHAAALLAAHEKLGDDALRVLSGEFAAALVDQTEQTAILAIDRMGNRPLCYARTATGGLAFGSNAQAVADHARGGREIDPQGIYDYVYFHVVPSPGSVYRGVSKLERGQRLVWRHGKESLDSYWLPEFQDTDVGGIDEFAAMLDSTLADAIERCDLTDNTAVFLSGGLDSSTVAGYAAKASKGSVVAYSIGFAAEGYDEMAYARIAARHFGIELRECYLTPEQIVSAVPEITSAYDEPFGNSSAVPALVCARLAQSEGKTAILAGDGGDEIFAGNERYSKQLLFEHYYRLPAWLRRGLVEPLVMGLPVSRWTPPTRKLRSYIEQALVPLPARLQTYNFLEREAPQRVFSAGFMETIETRAPLVNLQDSYESAPTDSILHKMLYLDWKLTLADNDLRKVNRMCETAGIDVLYPMLDDDLIALSARIPPAMKLKGNALRYFYKYAMKDFLPREILNKSKHGFGLPFGIWLKQHAALRSLTFDSLHSLESRGIFRPGFLHELIATYESGHAAYYGNTLWVLMILEQWLARHATEWSVRSRQPG